MSSLYKGLAVAVIHCLIILGMGAKLLYDRATCPRVWVSTRFLNISYPGDEHYVGFYIDIHADKNSLHHPIARYGLGPVELSVENGVIVAHQSTHATGLFLDRSYSRDEYTLIQPAEMFVRNKKVPRCGPLWAEVTVPKYAPPRPIQLAVKCGEEWIPVPTQ